ncbi:hypothetical protein CspHIS471_0400020 [Cutaneotrichosporon sp. HIS471]|nr:hypothetical protein CspHIS471_0400020 [Cutaneotrichosporon sp. HIS471]
MGDKQVSAGRPAYHFIAPKGWMNDPCGPGYDVKTGLYHLFYQWTPLSHRWHKIAWGHATSMDLLHWSHASPETPAIQPDQDYDQEGIFTGCFWPTGLRGEDQLSVFYTNVDALPLHWTLPYTRGCEGLAVAVSSDRGQTWIKSDANPILREEPADMVVTGFRDPFLAAWPAMDCVRGLEDGRLYGIISGGIKDVGPRTFLYEVDPADLTRWTYLHPLLRVPTNHRPAGRWGGDLGVNLECTNFLSLAADGAERQVIITGSEGGKPRPTAPTQKEAPERTPRYAPWLMGTLEERAGEIDLAMSASGMVDWGDLYAGNTFKHPDGRTVLWGWLIEEGLNDAALEAKSWTGCLTVPRELFLATYDGVTGALVSKMDEVRSFEVLSVSDGVCTVATLGIRPLTELGALRGEQLFHAEFFDGDRLTIADASPLACMINATFDITDDTDEVSFHVRHSGDYSTATRITFYPKRETIVVHRDASNGASDIAKYDEDGPMTLLRTNGGIEPLRLQVFLDHDVIEVFANDRFSLATRVYTSSEITGVSYSRKGAARVDKLGLWAMKATQ